MNPKRQHGKCRKTHNLAAVVVPVVFPAEGDGAALLISADTGLREYVSIQYIAALISVETHR